MQTKPSCSCSPGFRRRQISGAAFLLRHSALVEEVLASFPSLLDAIDVRCIAFPGRALK
ncbi:MAG: DUF3088 family protein [Mesorhizobium sp.]|nr:MAG: DUF3088 family protein [Mesorhizobium sp.]